MEIISSQDHKNVMIIDSTNIEEDLWEILEDEEFMKNSIPL